MAGCDVVNLDANICLLGQSEVACNLIRECDHLTGAVHFEYAMPEGSPNANIWILQHNNEWEWQGPDAANVPAPTIPAGVQPTIAPPAAVTLPAVQTEAAPPSGTWQFQAQPAVITPNLGPANPTPAGASAGALIPSGTILDDLTLPNLQQTIGDTGIPLWMLLAAGATAAYFVFGGKR